MLPFVKNVKGKSFALSAIGDVPSSESNLSMKGTVLFEYVTVHVD